MTTPEQTQKRRKVRAILASGLVLGVGAAVTLAAWNDSVWGSSTFGTGDSQWNLQGFTPAENAWEDFVQEGDAATMTFLPDNDALVPQEPVFSVFGLHEQYGNLGATIGLEKGNITGSTDLADEIDITATLVSGATTATPAACDATTTGDVLFSGPLSSALASAADAITLAPEGYAWVCFKAELSEDAAGDLALQDQQVTATWVFNGQSS
ncbi:SipW-dependent-type signal peptide-containing protein [Rhodococcus sp. Z13]|uniref:SipW-dependent-type signal peptide-containing protein n=1 Tax=Rhodococcus sacchari TaxID=2962047 RepID=A0ACD4DF72_9NOCA|nr:SipW-dependent-type signal peptide-containing protein [Rhodococcus sp. Z13]UYP18328.1 SipW-dependent-type signal peptide-containing protein [Rhodococcus sp. Z13]